MRWMVVIKLYLLSLISFVVSGPPETDKSPESGESQQATALPATYEVKENDMYPWTTRGVTRNGPILSENLQCGPLASRSDYLLSLAALGYNIHFNPRVDWRNQILVRNLKDAEMMFYQWVMSECLKNKEATGTFILDKTTIINGCEDLNIDDCKNKGEDIYQCLNKNKESFIELLGKQPDAVYLSVHTRDIYKKNFPNGFQNILFKHLPQE